jgi:L-ascorbate metabolism protein UlaG (beta-lactamase superfamily)
VRFAIISLAAILAAGAADRGEYFSTDSGPVNMTLVHHASFVIENGGRVIYVDPTGEGSYKGLPKADLILITKDDPDHLDMAAIGRYSRKTTAIIAPPGPAARLTHSTAMNPGETVRMGEIMIEAEPVSPATQGNGYVVTLPGLRVYISGDTGFYPEMKTIKNIDVAFLSVGSPGTMSFDDALKAIHAIKPKVLYPYQYRGTSPDEIRKQLATPGTEVRMRNWY